MRPPKIAINTFNTVVNLDFDVTIRVVVVYNFKI